MLMLRNKLPPGDRAAVSPERARYLRRRSRRALAVRLSQLTLLFGGLLFWELAADWGLIDSFIMSQPSRILRTFANLSNNGLLHHLQVTCMETLTGFLLGAAGGCVIAVALWWSELLARICEPFLVVLNSLPKIALGPVIILWVGAGAKAIIVMALAISMIVTVLEMLDGFLRTDPELLRMASTFGASRGQLLWKIVLPSNVRTLFNSLKINIGLSLVGVIAGEFLVSKAGLGYLIVYGGQVFQLDLVMASVFLLAAMAALLYQGVAAVERRVNRLLRHGESLF